MYVQEKKGVFEKIANKKYEKRQQKIEMISCLSEKFFFYYLANIFNICPQCTLHIQSNHTIYAYFF